MNSTTRRTWASAGFTIVELLIVIVVIAILAVIVVVAYNGIQQQARVSLVKNDLSQGRRILENFRTDNGGTTYPTSQSAAKLKPSGGVTYTYEPSTMSNPTDYCLVATMGTISMYVTGSNGVFQQGTCIAPDPPAQIVESIKGDFVNPTYSGTYNITTNVQPTDVIVAVIWKGYLGTLGLTGWGGAATWTNVVDRQDSGYPDFFVYTTTGMSGPGAVTVTVTTTSNAGGVALYVLRDVQSATPVTIASTSDDWTTVASPGAYRIVPTTPVSVGQVAIMAGWAPVSGQNTGTFPAQQQPAGAWTSDKQVYVSHSPAAWQYAAHYIPTGSVDAGGGIYYSTYAQGGATMLIFD